MPRMRDDITRNAVILELLASTKSCLFRLKIVPSRANRRRMFKVVIHLADGSDCRKNVYDNLTT